MADLSVLIPARNEQFLNHTIRDILTHSAGDTEILVGLDGAWPIEPIPDHPRVTIVHVPESIGQRAMTNVLARISQAKYVMKVDAHCAFDDGFDVKLLAKMQDDLTMVPVMRNLHAFDWVCENGHRRYQGQSGPCEVCGLPTEMEIVWIAKPNPQSVSYCFDASPHFQYFNEFKARPEYQAARKTGLTETMSLQGSCFLMTRERYHALNICDEQFGSWGSQGIEVAVKTWLSGGRCVVNHDTWYAHLFRTAGGDFGFPYPLSGKQVEHAKQAARAQFFGQQWQGVKPLSWLVEKFWPVPGWSAGDLAALQGKTPTRGILYYTDNLLDPGIAQACRQQIAAVGLPVTSVGLNAPANFGDRQLVVYGERGPLTMFRQILAGLEAMEEDVVFFCEHDVLYHPSHFDFLPPNTTAYFYNENVWQVRASDGHAVTFRARRLSQLCAYRETLVAHFRERVRRCEQEGFSRRMGFEPGTHSRPERVDDLPSEGWRSSVPCLDIKHQRNLTGARWHKNEFRSQRSCQDWDEADAVAGWYGMGEFGWLLGARAAAETQP